MNALNHRHTGFLAGLLLAACLALAPGLASALTLGMLHWQARPGQPTVAEIALTDTSPINPASMRVSIATPAAYTVAGLTYAPGLADVLISAQTTAPNTMGATAAVSAVGRPVLRLERLPPNTAAFDLLIVASNYAELTLTEYHVDPQLGTHDVAPSPVGTRQAALARAASAASAANAANAALAANAGKQPRAAEGAQSLQDVQSQARAALLAWAQAWSERDVAVYLAAYTADFAGNPAHASHQAWADQRRARIEARTRIQVDLKNLVLTRRGDTVTATFVQKFSSDGPSDILRKRLVLVQQNGRWLIQNELVLP